MKIRVKVNIRQLFLGQRSRGFAAMAMVVALGVTALLGLMFVFRRGMHSHDAQVRHQVKIDFKQKEDAFLRALIAEVPNAAINAMKDNSWDNRTQYSWNRIIQRAIDLSNSEQAISSSTLNSMSLDNHTVANSGDYSIGGSGNLVNRIAGWGTRVGPGNVDNTALLGNQEVGSKLPPPLRYAGPGGRDRRYPIISTRKTYPAGTPGLDASLDEALGWPRYNIINYPDIRFGFAAQDGKFVAKRNWWAFSVEFGRTLGVDAGIPSVRKNYVLSIYEVPAQSALSASGRMKVGEYELGGAWEDNSINIQGNIFSSKVEVAGTVDLLNSAAGASRISARHSIDLGSGLTTVEGNVLSNDYNDAGIRESRVAAGQGFYNASTAGDSGRVVILPLGQGEQFFRRTDDVTGMSNAISNTPWDQYALGARQCRMSLEIRAISGSRPTAVRFHYYVGGSSTYRDYDRDALAGDPKYWPNYNNDINGDLTDLPFYFERVAQNGSGALAINLKKLIGYLGDVLSANPVSGDNGDNLNNSLSIWLNETVTGVSKPPMASDNTHMSVVLRQCENLSAFGDGLSIVTDHRVYIAGNLNQVVVPNPPTSLDSGIPAGEDFFPPVSVFAPTIRFGTNTGAISALNISGQLSSLKDDNSEINLLDLKQSESGAGKPIAHEKVSANLSQIISPAQLPPITKMSWLVMIEEIHP